MGGWVLGGRKIAKAFYGSGLGGFRRSAGIPGNALGIPRNGPGNSAHASRNGRQSSGICRQGAGKRRQPSAVPGNRLGRAGKPSGISGRVRGGWGKTAGKGRNRRGRHAHGRPTGDKPQRLGGSACRQSVLRQNPRRCSCRQSLRRSTGQVLARIVKSSTEFGGNKSAFSTRTGPGMPSRFQQ